jgi:hypothetical protein
MTEPQRLAMVARVERGASITLADLRLLAAPATGADSFRHAPVYVRVGNLYYPVADYSTVSGPHASYIEIGTGPGITRAELDRARRGEIAKQAVDNDDRS